MCIYIYIYMTFHNITPYDVGRGHPRSPEQAGGYNTCNTII